MKASKNTSPKAPPPPIPADHPYLSRHQLTPADPDAITLASHIIQRLGESGQPPDMGVGWINVGNSSYLQTLDTEYFQKLLLSGSSFKLVQGYFGGGKTHFLHCVRELASHHQFATAIVELSPTECPYDDSLRVYQAVARRIAAPPKHLLAQPSIGFPELVRAAIDDRLQEELTHAQSQKLPDPAATATQSIRRWLTRTVARTPCESPSFRQATLALALAYLDENFEQERPLDAWLSGESVPQSALKDFGVYDTISRSNGFTMLRCLTQMVVALGLRGSALLFDEVDRNLSVSPKRSHTIGDNLRQVIDACGSSRLPCTLFMYAVPPEFMQRIVPEYPALYQRLKAPVPMSVRSPQSVLIDLERLDLEPVEMLSALGDRVRDVFQVARSIQLNPTTQSHNARALAVASTDAVFEVNHRRLFVKTWVDVLTSQAADGEQKLTSNQARDLVLGSYQGMRDPQNSGGPDAQGSGAPVGDDFLDF